MVVPHQNNVQYHPVFQHHRQLAGKAWLHEVCGWLYSSKLTGPLTVLQGSAEEKEQAGMVLLEVLEAARMVAVMLSPIVPALARLIYLQLGFTDQQFEGLTWQDAQWGGKPLNPKPMLAMPLLPSLFVLLLATMIACSRVVGLICLLSAMLPKCYGLICLLSAVLAQWCWLVCLLV